jgi:hypothetical protein
LHAAVIVSIATTVAVDVVSMSQSAKEEPYQRHYQK